MFPHCFELNIFVLGQLVTETEKIFVTLPKQCLMEMLAKFYRNVSKMLVKCSISKFMYFKFYTIFCLTVCEHFFFLIQNFLNQIFFL